MIELDRTDEEREELVKKWISANWLYVVGIVGLSIALVYGLNYYRQEKIRGLSQVAAKANAVNVALNDNNVETAKTGVDDLQNTQTDTTFATLSTLALAKKYFEAANYSEAIKQYHWVVSHAGDVSMRDIARLRKARAEANAEQYDNAVKTLGGLESQTYFSEAALLKGDVYMANQQFAEAKKSYDSLETEHSLNPELVQQRKDLLSIKQYKKL